MIRVACEQGTSEWAQARLGRVTASQLHRILTPTGKLSSQSAAYAFELLAEECLGVPMDNATSGFMERGTILERKARQFYEMQRDCTVEQVGFVMRDDGRVGCSPDGLVGDNGGVEIKVPSAPVHLSYLAGEAGEKYKVQIMASLWICERDYWDFVSFHPDLPSAIVRFRRDDEFIAKLAPAVEQFLSFVDETKAKLAAQHGLFPDFQQPLLKVV